MLLSQNSFAEENEKCTWNGKPAEDYPDRGTGEWICKTNQGKLIKDLNFVDGSQEGRQISVDSDGTHTEYVLKNGEKVMISRRRLDDFMKAIEQLSKRV